MTDFIYTTCHKCGAPFNTATSLDLIAKCRIPDCPFKETYCGLDESLNTGELDPNYPSSCHMHDVFHISKKAGAKTPSWLAVNSRFAYDVASTAVINTAKAVVSIAQLVYIPIGILGSAALWWRKK